MCLAAGYDFGCLEYAKHTMGLGFLLQYAKHVIMSLNTLYYLFYHL